MERWMQKLKETYTRMVTENDGRWGGPQPDQPRYDGSGNYIGNAPPEPLDVLPAPDVRPGRTPMPKPKPMPDKDKIRPGFRPAGFILPDDVRPGRLRLPGGDGAGIIGVDEIVRVGRNKKGS